jgi:hypothetical protein
MSEIHYRGVAIRNRKSSIPLYFYPSLFLSLFIPFPLMRVLVDASESRVIDSGCELLSSLTCPKSTWGPPSRDVSC